MIPLAREKILITGITGFIGTNLLRAFRAQGCQAYGISSSPIGLLHYEKLATHLSRLCPTLVFHLGAHVMLQRDYKTARRCFEVNIQGTLNLFEALAAMRQKISRFIFVSTEEVYGKSPLPYREHQPVAPPSPYAISKIAGEQLCRYYHTIHGIPYTILRFATVYGPFQPELRFIPHLIKVALLGKDIPLDSGKSARDYVYIDDAINALIRAATFKAARGQTINIGNAESVSSRKLVRIIVSLTKSPSRIKYNSIPARAGEALVWRSDISKANKLLHWKPKVSLEEGLRESIAYYRNLWGSSLLDH